MTLMEMLIAIALTAMISAIAFPAMDRMTERMALDQATTALVADLKRARAQAQRQGRPVALRFADDGSSYWWRDAVPVDLPRGVRAGMTDGTIGFFSDGSANGGQVTLGQGRAREYVRVQPMSGQIMTVAGR